MKTTVPQLAAMLRQHERQVGIMNEVRKQSTADVKKVPRGMRLANPWIKCTMARANSPSRQDRRVRGLEKRSARKATAKANAAASTLRC